MTQKTMKHSPKSKFGVASLIAIGGAGTALCLSEPPVGFPQDGTPAVASFRSFKSAGIDPVEVGTLHGKGEACGLAEWDSCLFVSHRGSPVRVLTVSAALKSGAVSAHKMLLRGLGPEREVTVYLRKGITPGMRTDKFVACPDVVSGRVESRLVSEPGGGPARNASYVGHLLPLAFKGGAAPAPASPTKTPTPKTPTPKTPKK